ncbi:aminotransferase class-III [Dactylonectria macrodidyma]|uniref:Aminotransferase class-III n=1 Tax=Dactylonectria macrodidyma TaxID=307937 RepID=A0A9P9EIN4_9HYPO|nr:aminotransferase class-III [Dactylonectria macrodidyma]
MSTSIKAERLLVEYLSRYEAKNPKSKGLIQDASKYLPGGTTRATLAQDPFPLVITSGQGAELTSIDGQNYVDYVSEYFAGIYGHSHPKILAAIEETAKGGLGYGSPHPVEAELAKLLVDRFPSVDRIRFCNSASEANIFAVASVLNFTHRSKVLVFENAYHGGAMSFVSAGYKNPLNVPHYYVFGSFNNIEKTKAVLEGLDSKDIGVVIVEPMQGAGGAILGDKAFFEYLREATTRIGAILIFDETITSRFMYGGLQTHLGVTPDMTTIGKHFGGGFSFGAFGGGVDIMAQFDPHSPSHLHHSGTFNNNVFSMKVGVAGTKLLTDENLKALNALGNKLRSRLEDILAAKDPSGKLAAIAGFGSILGVGWISPSGPTHRDLFYHFLLSKGIYIGHRGFVALNFAHEQQHLDQLAEAFQEFLALISE